MQESAPAPRVLVMGRRGADVGREVARRRGRGERVAGYVGEDEGTARAMADDVLGGLDELVVLPDGG